MTYPPLFPLLPLLLAAMTFLHAQEAPARQHIEITGSHTFRIVYDCSFVWPEGGGYTAVMKLPIPPDTGAQQIQHFSSSLKGEIETDDALPPHRLLSAIFHHDSGDERRVRWRIEILGLFQTRQLVDGPPPPGAAPVVPPPPGHFLASTESVNWDTDRFRSWLDSANLRRTAAEPPVAYGHRLYAYLRNNGSYSYPPETPWNAAAICHGLSTDCGGFSTVFVAACRANRIPARLLVGQWFKARKLSDGSVQLTDGRQAHVIAEFFDPQIGWIPEDISSTFLHTPGYPDLDFFGRDPGYFFTWHFDNDFRFDTPQKPDAHVQWIQNPSLWFSENASDVYDSLSHHWDIETLH